MEETKDERCDGDWTIGLPIGIIREAAYCFRAASKFRDRYPQEADMVRRDCLTFFESEWYEALTNCDRDELIRRIARECADEYDIAEEEFSNILADFKVKSRLSLKKYYETKIVPHMDEIVRDVASGVDTADVRKKYRISARRWSRCLECSRVFREKIERAKIAGAAARNAARLAEPNPARDTLERYRDEIKDALCSGASRAAVARAVGVSAYKLGKFVDEQKLDVVEWGKIVAMKKEARERLVEDLRVKRSQEFVSDVAAQEARDKKNEGDER